MQELVSQARERERAVKWQTLFSVGKFVFLSCDPWKCREFLLTVPEKLAPCMKGKILETVIIQTLIFYALLQELHKKLLDRYKSVSGGKLSNLQNDNYIYFYIGRHLNEAQMWSEFPVLYLDLEFVGAKLKATGPGDLLVDYKKYHKFITRDVSHEMCCDTV